MTAPTAPDPGSPSSHSRREKRWSGRLRTAGALLLLLGAVGFIDTVVNRSGGWPAALALAAAGAALFTLGRRWSRI